MTYRNNKKGDTSFEKKEKVSENFLKNKAFPRTHKNMHFS